MWLTLLCIQLITTWPKATLTSHSDTGFMSVRTLFPKDIPNRLVGMCRVWVTQACCASHTVAARRALGRAVYLCWWRSPQEVEC